jgi:hypothetical protein
MCSILFLNRLAYTFVFPGTGNSIENRTQTHSKINCSYTSLYKAYNTYNLPHVTAGAGDGPSQASHILDIEGAETPGKLFLFPATFFIEFLPSTVIHNENSLYYPGYHEQN